MDFTSTSCSYASDRLLNDLCACDKHLTCEMQFLFLVIWKFIEKQMNVAKEVHKHIQSDSGTSRHNALNDN